MLVELQLAWWQEKRGR